MLFSCCQGSNFNSREKQNTVPFLQCVNLYCNWGGGERKGPSPITCLGLVGEHPSEELPWLRPPSAKGLWKRVHNSFCWLPKRPYRAIRWITVVVLEHFSQGSPSEQHNPSGIPRSDVINLNVIRPEMT